MDFKLLTVEEQSKLSDEELKAYKQDEQKYFDESVKALEEKTDLSSSEVAKLSKDISSIKNNELKTILRAVETQGQVIKEMQDRRPTVEQIEEEAGEIVAKLKDNKDLKALKDSLVNGKEFGRGVSITVKGDVTSGASVIDNTYSQRIPGIGKQPVRRIFIADLFPQSNVGPNSGGKITYIDQANLTRAANNVAECTQIPESDIDWQEYECKIEKIGDSIPVCTEALEDFDFIQSEVENFLMENVMLRVDNQVLLGNGTSPEFKGIDSLAQTWSVTAGSPIEGLAAAVDDPTIANAIFSGISQIQNSGRNNSYQPNICLMNPQDYQLMLLEKDADGNTVRDGLVSIDNGVVRVAGVVCIPTPLVPQDVLYIFDSTRGIVYNHREINIRFAEMHADDFLFDRVRMKVTTRKAFVVRKQNENAFLKMDSIQAAITALTKV